MVSQLKLDDVLILSTPFTNHTENQQPTKPQSCTIPKGPPLQPSPNCHIHHLNCDNQERRKGCVCSYLSVILFPIAVAVQQEGIDRVRASAHTLLIWYGSNQCVFLSNVSFSFSLFRGFEFIFFLSSSCVVMTMTRIGFVLCILSFFHLPAVSTFSRSYWAWSGMTLVAAVKSYGSFFSLFSFELMLCILLSSLTDWIDEREDRTWHTYMCCLSICHLLGVAFLILFTCLSYQLLLSLSTFLRSDGSTEDSRYDIMFLLAFDGIRNQRMEWMNQTKRNETEWIMKEDGSVTVDMPRFVSNWIDDEFPSLSSLS